MGSGDWIKSIISLKKAKNRSSKRVKASASISTSRSEEESTASANGAPDGKPKSLVMRPEDRAAIRIQTAFRAHMARKALRRLKGETRMQTLTLKFPIKRQSASTLGHLHSWSKIQSEVKARRLHMVTEGRMRQKKLENQMKLEAKLIDLEVDWCSGSESMEEILARMYQKEDAAIKRERTMAYAFNHQWRANSSSVRGLSYEVSKANWGWSWMDCWIATQPWEVRTPITVHRQGSKGSRGTSPQIPRSVASLKPSASNGKTINKGRRLSFPTGELTDADGKTASTRRYRH